MEDKALINEHVIHEYVDNENDPRWFYNFMGASHKKEPVLWDWFKHCIAIDLATIHEDSGGAAFSVPTTGPVIDKLMTRAFLRGLYMGERRYTANLDYQIYTLPGEKPPIPEPRGRADPGYSEEGDLGEDDFSE